GQRNAQLIVEPVDVNDADERTMASLGFETLPNGMRLRKDAPVTRKDLLGIDMTEASSSIALASGLASLGFTLPPGMGVVDFFCLLAFGRVALVAAGGVVRDQESFAGLSPVAPPRPSDLDEAQKAALAGADARQIPTLDGMRGLAVILVLLFHFAWT